MAKKRVIDTEELYFDAELVDSLGDRGILLYIRLWSVAEDWGGYEPKYKDIAYRMGALKFETDEVEKLIGVLIGLGKIFEYEAKGRTFHWIKNLLKHQPLNNPSPPKLPLPEWIILELKEYKSGKKYALYTIDEDKIPEGIPRNSEEITGRLPVGYQYGTSRLPSYPEEKDRDEGRDEKSKTIQWDGGKIKENTSSVAYQKPTGRVLVQSGDNRNETKRNETNRNETIAKAGGGPPDDFEKEKLEDDRPEPHGQEKGNGHFSEKLKEKSAELVPRINAAGQSLSELWPDVWKFVQVSAFGQKNGKDWKQTPKHPMAIVITLERMKEYAARGKIENYWSYARSVLGVESKNFTEREKIEAHKLLMQELKRQYPRQREEDLWGERI